MSDDPKTIEARGYAKGYAAGKKRLSVETDREEARGRRERFRQDVYLAIISQMIEHPWGKRVDGKFIADSDATQISETAWQFAEKAAEGAWFL